MARPAPRGWRNGSRHAHQWIDSRIERGGARLADDWKADVVGDKVWQILRMFAQKGGAVALAEVAAKKSEH